MNAQDQGRQLIADRSSHPFGPVITQDRPAPSTGWDIVQIALRRRWLIAAVTGGAIALGAASITALTPQFTAHATLMLDYRATPAMRVFSTQQSQNSNADYVTDALAVSTQVEIVKSPNIARMVVQQLNLQNDPEFNADLRPHTFFGSIMNGARGAVHAVVAAGRRLFGRASGSAGPAETPVDRTVRALERNVSISNDGKSYVVDVAVESPDPAKAARIANAWAGAYLEDARNAKADALRWAEQWLTQQVGELGIALRRADDAVDAYRVQNHLVTTQGATVAGQQVSEINSQLTVAEADLAQKQASLRQAQDLIKSPTGVEAAAQVLASPVIQRFREQQAELQARLADLSTQYGPQYPTVQRTKAEIGDLQGRIVAEMNRIAHGIENEVGAAQARVQDLQTSLDKVQGTSGVQALALSQLRALEREANATQSLYDTYLARQKEIAAQENVQQADARIITEASVPVAPSAPNPPLILVAATAAGLIIGVLLALYLEYRDGRLPLTLHQLEHIPGYRGIGIVPEVPAGTGMSARDLLVKDPTSTFCETMRALSLRLLMQGPTPQVILVTSSLPEEGKTFFAVALARSMALLGKRTLLVDCDLRRPSVHKYLETKDGQQEPTLGEQRIPLGTEEETSLQFIASRKAWLDLRDALSSHKLWETLNSARQHYDVVIIDSPPVVPFADACSLSHLADSTVVLARWRGTPLDVVRTAMAELANFGSGKRFAVLSRVDLEKHGAYGFSDYGYYHRRYAEHYGRA
jgi:polysaccharide biosynthesis transport protein